MQRGDISNEVPKRILVTIDTFTDKFEMTTKSFKLFNKTTVKKNFNRGILSKIYMVASTSFYTFELVSFDMSEDDLLLSFNNLEKEGTNPFRYCTAYESVKDLVSALPYRPEVLAVVDMPSRKLQFGHWGMDFTEL